MRLKAHDLRQLDAEVLRRLHQRDPDALVNLSVRLLDDLKEAHERLNQSSHNSSRPPSSCGPWHKATPDEEESGEEDEVDPACAPTDAADPEADAAGPASAATAAPDEEQQAVKPRKKAAKDTPPRRPGKQKGAAGVARTQQIPITATLDHRPHACACCERALPPERAKPFTAFGALGVELGSEPIPSLRLTHTWHVYFEAPCDCGHVTREEPYRAPPDTVSWEGVEVTQWRLIDPSLAGLLVWLNLRMRLRTRLIREFLIETLGLELSVGAIRTSLLESARAADPVQELILEALIGCESQLAHADETPHPQAGTDLWLWTLVSRYAVVFVIGPRSKATFANLLGTLSGGWLMPDGYLVYRDYPKRLRCWAHLLRQARGLAERRSDWPIFDGRRVLELLRAMQDLVYAARESGPRPSSVRCQCQGHLDALRALCRRMEASTHEKTRQLGVEFLNDWDAIFRVLDHPHLPLTNNEAERTLRPWVILRRITYGTRTPQGRRARSSLAGIIETCRRRAASPLRYLQQVIAAGRQGHDMPPLPPIPRAVGG